MARATHDGIAAHPPGLVEKHPGRLDVGNDGGAGKLFEQIFRQQDQHLVTPEDVPLAVHHAQTVAVPVESQTEIRSRRAHPGL